MEEDINPIFLEPLPTVNLADCGSYLSSELKKETCMEEQLCTTESIKSEESSWSCSHLKLENDINPIFMEPLPGENDSPDPMFTHTSIERNTLGSATLIKVEKSERTDYNEPYPVSLVKCERLQDADMTVHSGFDITKGEHSVDEHVGGGSETVEKQPNTGSFGTTTVVKLEGGGVVWGSTGKWEIASAESGRESILQPHHLKEEQQIGASPASVEEVDMEAQEEREHEGVEGDVHFQSRVESSFPTAELSSVHEDQWPQFLSASSSSSSSTEVPATSQSMASMQRAASSHLERACAGKLHPESDLDSTERAEEKHCCPDCSFQSFQLTEVEMHIAATHRGVEMHSCPHCEYKSDWKGSLKTHIETVHKGEKNHSCPLCEYKCGQKSSLKKHIETVHLGERNHCCP